MSMTASRGYGGGGDPFSAITDSLRSLLDRYSPTGGRGASGDVEDFSPTSTVGLPGGGALTDVFQPLQKLEQVVPRIRMDITEQPDKYVVKAEIPGVKKESVTIAHSLPPNIRLSVENGLLTVTAEKRDENEDRKEERGFRYLRREISYGTVTRAIRLPPDATPEAVQAKFNDGVLEVEVPKTGEKKEKANVNVQ